MHVVGIVRKGEGIAKNLGYPTANVYFRKALKTPQGVYTGTTVFRKKHYHSIVFLGKPKTTGQSYRLEVYLQRFRGTLTRRRIKVYFYKKISGNIKFQSIGKLKAKIAQDKKKAERIFRSRKYKIWQDTIMRHLKVR